MSRPRFLADNDLNEQIIRGVIRREQLVEFTRVRDAGLGAAPDSKVLEYAASRGLIVVSHDVNTMPSAAFARLDSNDPMAGLFLARQTAAMNPFIESLILIWVASDAEEWAGQVLFLPI